MGDPKKHRSKYSNPKKAWDKERIDEEKELNKEYYFKNKSEIWKLTSKLRNFARQARRLITLRTEQAEKEKIQLLTKIKSLGLIPENGVLDDVLAISTTDLLNRRLQSIVFKKGLARSMRQARQFIVHGHVLVNEKKITSPNYIVPRSEEKDIAFSQSSSLIDPMHPERIQEEKMAKKPVKAKKEAKGKESKKETKQEKPKPKSEKKKEVKEKPKKEKKAE
ncbi:30S ribosomal protein S4 [Candidatus Woesearchaeota archaeon]|nr:30S ribosomal protein S4 [Candidatus Woesearchaeota archaeon]